MAFTRPHARSMGSQVSLEVIEDVQSQTDLFPPDPSPSPQPAVQAAGPRDPTHSRPTSQLSVESDTIPRPVRLAFESGSLSEADLSLKIRGLPTSTTELVRVREAAESPLGSGCSSKSDVSLGLQGDKAVLSRVDENGSSSKTPGDIDGGNARKGVTTPWNRNVSASSSARSDCLGTSRKTTPSSTPSSVALGSMRTPSPGVEDADKGTTRKMKCPQGDGSTAVPQGAAAAAMVDTGTGVMTPRQVASPLGRPATEKQDSPTPGVVGPK